MDFFRNGLYNSEFVKKYGLTTNGLKLLAVFSMVADHIGVYMCKYGSGTYWNLRKIGRLSFPIFAFCLVIGFMHTKSKKSYAKRLFVFAIISEIPFDLALYTARLRNNMSVGNIRVYINHQNVFFSLFIGFILLWCLQTIKLSIKLQSRRELMLMLEIATVAAFSTIAWLIHVDYSYMGVLLIVLLYLFREYFALVFAAEYFFNCVLYEGVQRYGMISILFLSIYNGKPGSRRWKWFFYSFYPLHLMVIALVNYYLGEYK